MLWTATDSAGHRATAAQLLTVGDTTAPTITSITPSLGPLGPPAHPWVLVTLSVTVSDLVDPAPACRITNVTRTDAAPPPDAPPDWEITGDLTISLRADPSGETPARIDTLTLTCTDRSGNTAVGSTDVTVPHASTPAGAAGPRRLPASSARPGRRTSTARAGALARFS